jgi:hypothetical protein
MVDLPSMPPAISPGEKPTFQLVQITNRNDFTIHDMFDGIPYKFEPNKPLAIPVDAASHFFMWPCDDPALVRLWISKRHGWNTAKDIERQADGRMRWEHWVDKITVAPVHFDLVQRDPDAPIPADAGEADETMTDSDLPPVPATRDDITETKVGVRKNPRFYKKTAPRRVDV